MAEINRNLIYSVQKCHSKLTQYCQHNSAGEGECQNELSLEICLHPWFLDQADQLEGRMVSYLVLSQPCL